MTNLENIPPNLRVFVSAWAIGKDDIDVTSAHFSSEPFVRINYKYKSTGRTESELVRYVYANDKATVTHPIEKLNLDCCVCKQKVDETRATSLLMLGCSKDDLTCEPCKNRLMKGEDVRDIIRQRLKKEAEEQKTTKEEDSTLSSEYCRECYELIPQSRVDALRLLKVAWVDLKCLSCAQEQEKSVRKYSIPVKIVVPDTTTTKQFMIIG